MRPRRILPLVGLLMAILLLGACSSGASKKTVTTTPEKVSSGLSSSSKTTKAPSSDTGSDTKSDTGKKFSGDSNSSFCSAFRKYDSDFSDASEDEASEKKVLDALKDLKKKAPSSIKGDIDTVIQFFEQISSIGSDNLAGLQSLQSSQIGQKVEQATEHLNAYVSQVCGVDVS